MTVKILIGATLFVVAGYFGIHQGIVPGLGVETIERDLREAALAALDDAGVSWAGVTMDGQQAVLSGTAPNRDAAEAAAEIVRKAVWAGGLVAGGITRVDISRVRYEAMRDAALPVASPFTWSAILAEDGSVSLVGFVPDDRIRLSLVADAEGMFPAGVTDAMQVARGMPDGDWHRAASLSLSALSRMESGTVSAENEVFSLIATARDAQSAALASDSLDVFPEGLKAIRDIHLPDAQLPEQPDTDVAEGQAE